MEFRKILCKTPLGQVTVIVIPITDTLFIHISYYKEANFNYNKILSRDTISMIEYITKDTYQKFFFEGQNFITNEEREEMKSLIQEGRLHSKRNNFELYAEGDITTLNRKDFLKVLDQAFLAVPPVTISIKVPSVPIDSGNPSGKIF